MRWLALLLMLLLAPDGFTTLAQEPAPTARQDAIIRVGEAGPLVLTGEGDLLAVGDGAQLQFYDVSEPASPRDLVTLLLPNLPRALAANNAMTLVAVDRGAAAGEILVVAPDPYSGGLPAIVNSLPTGVPATRILVSPDDAWAVVLSDEGYRTLRLRSPNVIESSALVRTPDVPLAAALLGDSLLLAQAGETRIDRLPLRLSPGLPAAEASLEVDTPLTALAALPDGTLGAAVLEDDELVLFDPQTMTRLRSLTLEDGPATALHFTASGSRQILIVQIANRPAVMLLDLSDPNDVSLPGSAGLRQSGSVIATDAAGARFVLATRDQVALFTLD